MKAYLAILMSLLCTAVFADEPPINKPKGWLLEAESDSERFELLQRYLRGFDQPMWEVGERYRLVYEVNDSVVTVTVISVGKRDKGKVYKAAMDRIN